MDIWLRELDKRQTGHPKTCWDYVKENMNSFILSNKDAPDNISGDWEWRR